MRDKKYNCDKIEVHHIIKISDSSELAFESSNLITLCSFHHHMADKNEIPAWVLKEIVSEQKRKSM
ncbi:MAG: HNH endonuclease [Oscillospiraceae bacterium]|nr:HNH endonuclease [Oscillospiraceae bacterium]